MADPGMRFAYDALDEPTRRLASLGALRIRGLGTTAIDAVIEIGKLLVQVKEALPHGCFGEWLYYEFKWQERTAQRLMNVARVFKCDTAVSHLPIDLAALYLLAAPSTPPEIRSEAIDRASTGERITCSTVKSLGPDPQPVPPGSVGLDATARKRAVDVPADGVVTFRESVQKTEMQAPTSLELGEALLLVVYWEATCAQTAKQLETATLEIAEAKGLIRAAIRERDEAVRLSRHQRELLTETIQRLKVAEHNHAQALAEIEELRLDLAAAGGKQSKGFRPNLKHGGGRGD